MLTCATPSPYRFVMSFEKKYANETTDRKAASADTISVARRDVTGAVAEPMAKRPGRGKLSDRSTGGATSSCDSGVGVKGVRLESEGEEGRVGFDGFTSRFFPFPPRLVIRRSFRSQ